MNFKNKDKISALLTEARHSNKKKMILASGGGWWSSTEEAAVLFAKDLDVPSESLEEFLMVLSIFVCSAFDEGGQRELLINNKAHFKAYSKIKAIMEGAIEQTHFEKGGEDFDWDKNWTGFR